MIQKMERQVMDFDKLPINCGKLDLPPKLSIVIPVFNVDEWLSDCLKSIQAQTFTAWECLLIDDGSTDISGIICDNFAKRDTRFRVIHQENQGVSKARNVGIKMATASFLTFIDPDDFISTNYFESQITEMQKTKADVSVAAFFETEEDGTEGRYSLLNVVSQNSREKSYQRFMQNNKMVVDALCGNLFSCVSWGKIFRRSLWAEARFPVGVDLGEDMMTVPAVIVKASSAVSIQEAVYYYRQRRKSLLNGTVSKERLQQDMWASSKMVEQLTAYLPERKEAFEWLKMQYDIGCINSFRKSNPDEPKRSILKTLFTEQIEADRRKENGYYQKLEEQIEKQKRQDCEMDSEQRRGYLPGFGVDG